MRDFIIKINMKNFKGFKFSWRMFVSKKFVVAVICVVVLAVGAAVGISAIRKQSFLQFALDNLAEARFYMKQAQNDSVRVQFTSGVREEPYQMDGVANKTTAFAILNVDPRDNSLRDRHEVRGSLKIGGEVIEVTLDRNPYDRNFAADLGRLVDVGEDISVTLFLTEHDHPTFALGDAMPEGAVGWEQALAVATDHHYDDLACCKKFEVYVKIINDLTKESGAFWYVQFIHQDSKTNFCVIAPDGSVVG